MQQLYLGQIYRFVSMVTGSFCIRRIRRILPIYETIHLIAQTCLIRTHRAFVDRKNVI